MDRELLQDSDGVNESFWDGQGVEIEAKDFLEAIRGCGGSRWIKNFSRIRMVLTRASGTVRASRLKQNKCLMFVCRCRCLCWCLCVCVCGPDTLYWGGLKTKENAPTLSMAGGT